MVPFAGYWMPVNYADSSISSSHIHTRTHVSIFDVSHMLQTEIRGKDKIKFMESITVLDLKGLAEDRGALTVMTTSQGGIIDDLIVTKTRDGYLYVVSNAGCRDKDLAHIRNQLSEFKKENNDVKLEIRDDLSLIAVQGPGAAAVIQSLIKDDISNLAFMDSRILNIENAKCRVTRCGYTGEDGFELSIPNEYAVSITQLILNNKSDSVKLAGLGARDSLRLEAGLCLYGNDMDENVTPVEASLSWLIGKTRRETADFPGADKILSQLKSKPQTRRVGFISHGPAARAGTKILNPNGDLIGTVTSGCPSPSLKHNISMGYVKSSYTKIGTEVVFDIRNKMIQAQVTKMPFVAHRYYTKK
uniref:Aminomethyltransferase n=1 Tax=Strigamia maritima TaxID=126957 RepID=T1JDN7_STRMM